MDDVKMDVGTMDTRLCLSCEGLHRPSYHRQITIISSEINSSVPLPQTGAKKNRCVPEASPVNVWLVPETVLT